LHALLQLHLVHTHSWNERRKLTLLLLLLMLLLMELLVQGGSAEVHVLKLLCSSSNAEKLLLEALLLGSEKQVGRHQFSVYLLIHSFTVPYVDSRRC
jgi:hypothetical protein